MDWFKLDKARQKTILEQTSAKTGIPVYAVEKDIWVSILLKAVFNDIRQHRQKYSPIKTTDYYDLTMVNISFIPEGDTADKFEADYKVMKGNMIYGEGTLEWVELIKYLQKMKVEMVS